jgi:hypothetical protein
MIGYALAFIAIGFQYEDGEESCQTVSGPDPTAVAAA